MEKYVILSYRQKSKFSDSSRPIRYRKETVDGGKMERKGYE